MPGLRGLRLCPRFDVHHLALPASSSSTCRWSSACWYRSSASPSTATLPCPPPRRRPPGCRTRPLAIQRAGPGVGGHLRHAAGPGAHHRDPDGRLPTHLPAPCAWCWSHHPSTAAFGARREAIVWCRARRLYPSDTVQVSRALLLPAGLPFAAIDQPIVFAFYARKAGHPCARRVAGVVATAGGATPGLRLRPGLGPVVPTPVQWIGHCILMWVLPAPYGLDGRPGMRPRARRPRQPSRRGWPCSPAWPPAHRPAGRRQASQLVCSPAQAGWGTGLHRRPGPLRVEELNTVVDGPRRLGRLATAPFAKAIIGLQEPVADWAEDHGDRRPGPKLALAPARMLSASPQAWKMRQTSWPTARWCPSARLAARALALLSMRHAQSTRPGQQIRTPPTQPPCPRRAGTGRQPRQNPGGGRGGRGCSATGDRLVARPAADHRCCRASW